jgi:hypothetical protein
MPPSLEDNDFPSLPNDLPRYAQHEFNPNPRGAASYATSPLGSTDNSTTKEQKPGVDALESLRALPEVRLIAWVPGKELPPEKSTESPRSQTRGAFLLATRRHARNPPCSHCAPGVGRFSVWVSLEGWSHGACSTCQMGTRGNICSLRKDAQGRLRPLLRYPRIDGVNRRLDLHSKQAARGSSYPSPASDRNESSSILFEAQAGLSFAGGRYSCLSAAPYDSLSGAHKWNCRNFGRLLKPDHLVHSSSE